MSTSDDTTDRILGAYLEGDGGSRADQERSNHDRRVVLRGRVAGAARSYLRATGDADYLVSETHALEPGSSEAIRARLVALAEVRVRAYRLESRLNALLEYDAETSGQGALFGINPLERKL
jgi:hypothetical protein